MKSKLQFSKKAGILLIAIAMLSNTAALATTFTAVMSGSWNSTATWGGSIPSCTLTSDRVNIPVGITVSLNQTLVVNGGPAILDVEGTLTSDSDDTLSFGLGNIVGSGMISVNNIDFLNGSSFLFSGTVVASNLRNASSWMLADATLIITKSLTLTYGSMNLVAGGSFQIGANADINISGGVLTTSGGNLDLTAPYNVNYSGQANQTGFELNGSGLNNLSLDVPSVNTVSLASDLVLNGTLNLISGTLVLNDHNLNIKGDIAAAGSGAIFSTSGSDVSINTPSSPSGNLQFAAGGNLVNNFLVNISAPNGSVIINSDLHVNGSISLLNGNVDIGNNGIFIGAGGSIVGGGISSYIVTTRIGFVSRNIPTGNTSRIIFPVGTSGHFAPIFVQLNAGSTGGTFFAGVSTGVLSQGTTGTDLAVTQPLVDATWHVESDISSGLDVNLKVVWSPAIEVNGFDETTAYIAHYTIGDWDLSPVTTASFESNGLLGLERTGIHSLSPFAVFSQNATNISANSLSGAFELYPNPASTNINIKNLNAFGETKYADIYDEAGRIINTYHFSGSEFNLPLDKLSDGTYFLKLYDDKTIGMKRFVKINSTN